MLFHMVGGWSGMSSSMFCDGIVEFASQPLYCEKKGKQGASVFISAWRAADQGSGCFANLSG